MDARRQEAIALLDGFAERTGLDGGRPPRRYLWTDAFAVCTLLGLARDTGDPRHREQALRLIDQVHHVLGRHRPDDRRRGWLSGLSEADGEAHPTGGGLRIGKPLPERRPDQPFDERLEWERDGQYFHYLTKWMHALDQAARAAALPLLGRWARELAATAHHAFRAPTGPGAAPRLYWKMSIDLSRPLVAAVGPHDPLDGLITCLQLGDGAPDLGPAIADFAAMVDPRRLANDDPLAIGGLLTDAHRLLQLGPRGTALGLVDPLLHAARIGLEQYAYRNDLGRSAVHRLAFRELGLAIGLAALARGDWPPAAAPLRRFAPLAAEIEAFWRHPAHRQGQSWLAHADINDVMLASCLQPDGFLLLAAREPAQGRSGAGVGTPSP